MIFKNWLRRFNEFWQSRSVRFYPDQTVSKPTNTLLENLTTAFDVSKYNGGSGSNSKAFTMLDVWGPIVDELNESGANFENPAVFLVGGFCHLALVLIIKKMLMKYIRI